MTGGKRVDQVQPKANGRSEVRYPNTKSRRSRLRGVVSLVVALAACLVFFTATASAAQFEITGFSDEYNNKAEEAETAAGGHPYMSNDTIEVATEEKEVSGSLKTVVVETPLGLIGNPREFATCTSAELAKSACPSGSQVGTFTLHAVGFPFPLKSGLYNMVPSRGEPARFGTPVLGGSALVYFDASVRPTDHGINITSSNISELLPIGATELKFWGVPGDSSHESERGGPAGVPPQTFLSMPTNCERPMVSRLLATSWQEPARVIVKEYRGPQLKGCEGLEFKPGLSVRPENQEAATPSGYQIELTQELQEKQGTLVSSHLKDATVALPEGVAINPSAASGLSGCTDAQFALGFEGAPTCPSSSKIGTVAIETPLLKEPLTGAIYQAAQNDNPFHSLLAIYMSPESERYGVRIKLAGKVETDPSTGKLTVKFDNNPQQPFSKLTMKLDGGPRAVLVNPPTCGTKTTSWSMTPWARPSQAVSGTSTFTIDSGPGGGTCPAAGPGAGFAPQFEAGSENPTAGAQTPFNLRLTREDGQQPFGRLDATLPAGLLAKLGGVPYCQEGDLNRIYGNLGAAAGEIANPACPAASQVGEVTVGAGAGSNPFYLKTGKVYLGGPYKGAPLSLAFVVPVAAGPLDLGNVTIRAAVELNPANAQVSVKSDPLPTMLDGIPLNIRDLRVNINRSEFMTNPTDCSASNVDAMVFSSFGDAAGRSERYQVGSCGSLGFSPPLKLQLNGGTGRGAYEGLRAVLQPPPGQANIGRVAVRTPHALFLAQEHIHKVCTRVEFAASECPKDSIYGYAVAWSPLLGYRLQGNVYLRSSSHKLPDLVADLRGPSWQPIRIELDGRIDSVKGQMRTTFDVVPDAPVSYFRLQLKAGKRALLVNSTDVCTGKLRAAARIDDHNGRKEELRPLMRNPRCNAKGTTHQKKQATHSRRLTR